MTTIQKDETSVTGVAIMDGEILQQKNIFQMSAEDVGKYYDDEYDQFDLDDLDNQIWDSIGQFLSVCPFFTQTLWVCVLSGDCSDTEFQCLDKKRCVDKRRRCDAYADCLDQSDEKNCQDGKDLALLQSSFSGKLFGKFHE